MSPTHPESPARPSNLARTVALAALGLGLVGAPLAAAGPQGLGELKPSTFINCTPNTIELLGEPMREARNPIAEALGVAGPGSIIRLRAGDYPAFGVGYKKPAPWNARTSGGLPGKPILVQAQGRVRVLPGDRGDTLSVDQGVRNGHITFEGITFVPGYRAGIFFSKQEGRPHTGYRFHDCDVIGSWDHVAQRGGKSKWGVWGHSLEDFEFRGVSRPARIQDLRYEHAFYLQNTAGNLLIENVQATRLGRTFLQLTNRTHDGPPGRGFIQVKDCEVTDIGLSKDDNYKGGTAFTIAGRHFGTILLEGNSYRCGFDPRIAQLTRPGVPFGTGGIVVWDGGQGIPSSRVILKDNTFEFAEGCGDRAVAMFGAVQRLHVVGENSFLSGAHPMAMVLEPREHGDGAAVGEVWIDPDTRFRGRVVRGERTLHEDDLAELAPPESARRDAEREGSERR